MLCARADAEDAATQRKVEVMGKNKKKAANETRKGTKRLTDYKSRETEGKVSQTDAAFQKALGRAKGIPRKG